MNDSKIPNKVSSCFYSEIFLFSDFFVYLQEKSKNLEMSVTAIIAEQPQAGKKQN